MQNNGIIAMEVSVVNGAELANLCSRNTVISKTILVLVRAEVAKLRS